MRITVQASRRLNTGGLSKQEQTLLNRELLNMLNLSYSPPEIWFKTIDKNFCELVILRIIRSRKSHLFPSPG